MPVILPVVLLDPVPTLDTTLTKLLGVAHRKGRAGIARNRNIIWSHEMPEVDSVRGNVVDDKALITHGRRIVGAVSLRGAVVENCEPLTGCEIRCASKRQLAAL